MYTEIKSSQRSPCVSLRVSGEFLCLVSATDLACSIHPQGIHPFAFLAKSLGVQSAKQRAIEKNPIGMQRLGMILFGPFGIFFQETVPLYASARDLSLIHASPPFDSNMGTGCVRMSRFGLFTRHPYA